MKNNKENAAKHFAKYFNISVDEAKKCNYLTLEMMVKYVESINNNSQK